MVDFAIETVHLFKSYRLGEEYNYGNLREVLSNSFRGLFKRDRDKIGREVQALEDVNLVVKPGEVLGIIGRNGAGKSTLLKILSRITKPTSGEARIYGRSSALLEVGTGFHPDLTGRENIYLNAAILGMSRREIKSRFDEIVDFSGIKEFLDTPVKRYSSGMYVRLAFSIAAFLESEIMLVDEVLAVGDALFQRKCLGKMEQIASGGRTVLFVSHNTSAIENLCDRCIVIDKGRIVFDGSPREAISFYHNTIGTGVSTVDLKEDTIHRTGDGRARLRRIEFMDLQSKPVKQVFMGDSVKVKMVIEAQEMIRDVQIAIYVRNRVNQTIFRLYNRESSDRIFTLTPGMNEIICLIHRLPLLDGIYTFKVWIGEGGVACDSVENAAALEVLPADVYNTGKSPSSTRSGMVWVEAEWGMG